MEKYTAKFTEGQLSHRFTLTDGRHEITIVRDKGEHEVEIWLKIDGGRMLMPTTIPIKELMQGLGITKEEFE